MKYDKALIISRYHDDFSNPIYNAYVRGIQSQCSIIHFIDYFDQIGALGKQGFEEQIENLLVKEEINLIFFIFVSGDPILDPLFIQKVAAKRFIAMVFWDSEQFFEQIDRYYAQLADLVILPANYEYFYKLKGLGINAICSFSLFDKDKYKSLNNPSMKIDVSFVGEVTKGKRKEYISYLEENGINIEAYGNGTKNGKVSFERVVEIFNTSKINLSFTGTYANSVYSFCSNINDRILQNKGKPIEIAMCGGFVLTEYVPGIEKVFPQKDIDTFQTKEELLEKIRFYLSHESLRSKMAASAHLYASHHYDSIEAFGEIFKQISCITPKENKNLILDPIFLKVHNTFHFYYFITFLFQERFALALEEMRYIIKNRYLILKDAKRFLFWEMPKIVQKIKLKRYCNALFNSIGKEDVVIYGAGIHTLTLMEAVSTTKNLNLKAIADKDPTKWGKKMFRVPVVSPDKITTHAKCVIISSFAFEKEIKKELLQMYADDITIYTLYDNFNVSFTSAHYQRTDPYQKFRNLLVYR